MEPSISGNFSDHATLIMMIEAASSWKKRHAAGWRRLTISEFQIYCLQTQWPANHDERQDVLLATVLCACAEHSTRRNTIVATKSNIVPA